MSVTSLNQVRHLYVAKSLKTTDNLSVPGDIKVKSFNGMENEVFFEVMGAETVLKSDRIPVKNIVYAKAIKSSDMAVALKKVTVTLTDDAKDTSGNPISGQDYILRINLRQFYGMSDQDQYFKDAAVHVTKNMTATQFYAALVDSLNKNFSREVGATATTNPYFTFTSSSAGLVIEEKAQPWTLGTEAQERVYFDVVPTTIYDGEDDVIWGTAAVSTSNTTVGNGKKIADLEYFLLGERGDQYRKISWPNAIETLGVVDPAQNYDVFEIHYQFHDTGVNSYATEKDITIVVPAATTTSESGGTVPDYTVINAVISAFNTATGLSVSTLS